MTKLDPRAEPESDTRGREDLSVDRVPPSARPGLADVESGQPRMQAVDEGTRKVVTSADPRLAPLEALLDKNDWQRVYAELGAVEGATPLPPNLSLVASIAAYEVAKEGDSAAVSAAIRAMAALLGVAENSPIARVLARRLLRKNPARITERAAPPARTSAIIVVIALLIGGGIGLVVAGASPVELVKALLER
jgi:hypothetical protein